MLLALSIVSLGVFYVVAGVISRRVLPRNRIGPLMALIGCGWLLDYLVDNQVFLLLLAAKLWPAMVGHLVVAFPTGRLLTAPQACRRDSPHDHRRVLAVLRYLNE